MHPDKVKIIQIWEQTIQYNIQRGWIITHIDNIVLIYYLWNYVYAGKFIAMVDVIEAYFSAYIYETVKMALQGYMVYPMILNFT